MNEDLKINPADFGGFQSEILSAQDRAMRYCAVKDCASAGFIQVGLPKYQQAAGGEPVQFYRLLCRGHLVQMTILVDAFYGDPSPLSEATYMAEVIGLDVSILLGTPPEEIHGIGLFNPHFARCVLCGGKFLAETVGMFSGRRFIHTCPRSAT